MNSLFILSGPSGVGKDTVIKALQKRRLPLHFAVTVTTRERRMGEVDGKDYFFVSPEKFAKLKEEGKLIEWAQVYGNWYGVPREEIERGWREGKGVLVKVDIQGAKTLKRLFPQATLIFLSPPGFEELVERLRKRHTESVPEQGLRLQAALQELESGTLFDYHVVNADPQEACAQIEAIINSLLHKQAPAMGVNVHPSTTGKAD